jgi:dihydroorotate dehydrogenase
MTLIIGNAAGTVKTLDQARTALASAMTKVKIGSTTMLRRDGNIPAPRVYHFDAATGTAVNAIGLQNNGIEDLLTWLPEFNRDCHNAAKECEVSIAGFSPEEYASLYYRLYNYCDLVELNMGCPNVYGSDAGRKPIPSYDPDLFASILARVKAVRRNARVGVKLSPVTDTTLLRKLCAVMNDSGIVVQIVAVNTEPGQGMQMPDGSEALSFRVNDGGPLLHRGGRSGTSLAPAVQTVLRYLIQNMAEHVRFIACGGIFGAEQMVAYHDDFNPDGYEFGTAYYEYGPRVIGESLAGIPERMAA